MNANPILLQKKYVRIVELFAEKMGISVETALGIFYHSQLYQLIRIKFQNFQIFLCVFFKLKGI